MKAARVLWQSWAVLALLFGAAYLAAPETDFLSGSSGWWSNFTVLFIGVFVLALLLLAAVAVTALQWSRQRKLAPAARPASPN